MIEPFDLALKFVENHPADAATILETMPPANTSEFLTALNDSAATEITTHLAADYVALCIPRLSIGKKVYLFNHLPSQVSADIFRYLGNEEKYNILKKLPLLNRLNLQTISKYNQNSVGAWMSTSFISARIDNTVEEVIELIQASDLPNQDYVFVVNAKRQFESIVNTSQLLKASLKTYIGAVANASTFHLQARATLQEISQHVAWKHFTTLPVIEHDKRLVGALSYNAVTMALDKSHVEFSARTSDIGDEALSLFWILFNNFIQLLDDFYSIAARNNIR
ncbi:magnesium transporter MgtE N-terminal domain-containing protein [Kaarinaea lacus]